MTEATNETLYRRLIGKTITFKKAIEDAEEYAEPGMRASIVDIQQDMRHAHCVPAEQIWTITFSFAGFDDINKPFETANYYDKNGNPCLTAREAGQYKEVDTYYLPGPDGWSDYFSSAEEDPGLTLADEYRSAGHSLPYIAWLEQEIMRLRGAQG